jgi:hypothetical protein
VSDCDFYLGVEIDIPPCLDRYTVLSPLCVVTSNVHIRVPDCHAGLPSGACLNALSYILYRLQVLAEVFSDDLETLYISKGSSEAPSPTIDYPSAWFGSLVTSYDNNRLRQAGRHTCLARRQRVAALGDCCSS